MRLLQESLLHGFALGPLALGGYWLFADHGAPLERIVIDRAQVESIRTQFRGIWSRYPTDAELQRLVESVARDEIFNREGEIIGLGRNDPTAMERVRQKYEALADSRIAARAPTDAELADWLELHAADYAPPATVTYSQILLVAAGTSGDVEAAARRAKIRLNHGAKPERVGLQTPLPAKAWQMGLDEIAAGCGPSFANALTRLPPRVWQGPVFSRYGAHLVRVESVAPAAPPSLDEVRDAVTRDYERARRERVLESTLEAMRQKYEIIVEPQFARQASRR
jgi:parvulin-like peptidyl-prolyl cis-trans isomerase-like protein